MIFFSPQAQKNDNKIEDLDSFKIEHSHASFLFNTTGKEQHFPF